MTLDPTLLMLSLIPAAWFVLFRGKKQQRAARDRRLRFLVSPYLRQGAVAVATARRRVLPLYAFASTVELSYLHSVHTLLSSSIQWLDHY